LNLPLKKEIVSIDNTKLLAVELSQYLKNGNIVVLNGNLGSGKTTLIKFICQQWGISNVNSPSFAIVNEYYGTKKVYHFDFYRLKKIEELYDIGFEEYLSDEDAIVFIEWGNLMSEILPQNYLEIFIDTYPTNERKIEIIEHN
jgi:tRNA threonylcarbamoyladenosine biosynthesis protein TsaE